VNANQNVLWTAAEASQNIFANHSLEELRGLMGLRDYPRAPSPVSSSPPNKALRVSNIPSAFDARTKWPSCTKPIRDQAKCGSCWAFAAAETLTDNLCVLGDENPALSPQDFVSCDSADHGCQGGTLLNVWQYIDDHGAVSDECIPYTSGDGSNATCSLPGCSGSGSSTVHKCPVAHTMLNSDEEIMAAVMTAGAVEVGFWVMEDFMNYKEGIYHYQEGATLGGHAVKVVGWGHEESTFFWIVQNSWGASWGENGYFRIENWHDDKASGFAIGGGFACVDGATPTPPSPTPAPSTCKDIVSYCKKDFGTHAKCAAATYAVPVCKKTCGCCSDLPPSYCSSSTS
jgi:cathepsin B